MLGKIAMSAGLVALVALASPAMAETKADYFGHWVNVDPATKSLVSVDVGDAAGSQISVHPYGKCHPTPCDWGAQNADHIGGNLNFKFRTIYHQGFANKVVVLDIDPVGTLRVKTMVNFTDGRENYVANDVFHRAPVY